MKLKTIIWDTREDGKQALAFLFFTIHAEIWKQMLGNDFIWEISNKHNGIASGAEPTMDKAKEAVARKWGEIVKNKLFEDET